ncbi:hypothetical protein MMC13_003223 [Lambiella insularis]|nr:hypothetical protein [Lambiella insularis]
MRLSSSCRGSFTTILLVATSVYTEGRLLHDLHHQHKQHRHESSVLPADHGSNFVTNSQIGIKSNMPGVAALRPETSPNVNPSRSDHLPAGNQSLSEDLQPFLMSKADLKVRMLDDVTSKVHTMGDHGHHETCHKTSYSKVLPIQKRQATSDSICPAANGTMFTSAAGVQYQTICNINIPDQDLLFQTVATFRDCVAGCDSVNSDAGENNCLAAIFLPNRVGDTDDCYLKYATDNATPVTTGLIDGAILVVSQPVAQSTTSSSASASSTSSGSGPRPVYASGNRVVVPSIAYSQLHGPTKNTPSGQYIDIKLSPDLTLAKSLLIVGDEVDLSIDYGISPDTGVLPLNSTTIPLLTYLTDTPHLSRDGGKGGYLNGAHMFIFCDTGSYSTTTDNTNGNFLAFVSSSVATDTGMYALYGNPVHLEDGIGEWSDNVGRMRGFSPLTAGEQGYNLAMQGQGQRYAIWPESSIIPVNNQSAILYAPIVYDNVDMTTKVATFTYTGATLLTVTAGSTSGPIAERTVDRLFQEDEVEWGCVGGIRSWGPSGIGGNDGMVYLFGNVRGGLLLAKVSPNSVADRSSYQYWTGNQWSFGMQAPTSTAYFIPGSFMDVDVFYSPRHLTFICVYMTIYADSTFYYRYLLAGQAILPPFAPGGDSSSDYVANILQYNWSDEIPLYKTGSGLNGAYTYAGGVHQGYFGQDDITNGGSKMMLSWTAPTGLDPASETSEYQIVTAEIAWN